MKKGIICAIVFFLFMTSSNIYADELKTTRKTQGFIYEIIGEKEEAYAKIVSYDPNVVRGEKLVIPTAVDGYDVKGFSDYIFQGTSFKYCDLSLFPNLSAGMFCDSQIEEVKLSEGIKKIPDIIFADSQLKKIDIPRSTEIICQRAFFNTKLEEIVIPSGVKNIEYNAFEECNYVKKIVINEGLKELPDRENAFCGAAFETPNLEKLYLPKSIEYISPNEFKESYNQRFVGYIYSEKYPTMTIYAPVGSYAETYAAEHNLNFAAIKAEKADISKYTESEYYHVEKIIPTEYGTVLYFWAVGTPHGGKNPKLVLIKKDGSEINLSETVSRADLFHAPELDNIVLSENGKDLTFSVSFEERSEGSVADGEKIVLHDAGTYFYKANLEEGICIETKFEPLDTISEEVISAWAKPEVENAIEMGFVPISLRGNYKRNITRREFAKMAFYFLSVQYGYRPEPALETWYRSENPDYAVRTENFVSAYCSGRKDRNGNVFTNKNTGEAWKYEDKHGGIYNLTLASPFTDLQAAGDGMNTAAQRAVIGENQIIDYAYNFGIINGKSDTEFDPHGEITRQEAAAMLMRVYKNYADVNMALGDTKFSDDDKISDWAKDDVYNINVLGVMQGVGENTFAPLEGYTVEQSVATFWRLYDKAPLSRKNKNIEPLLKYSYERENFFTNVPGTSVFTAEKESPYEEYTVVRGYHRRYHRKNDYRAYVFYKYGGCLDLLSFIPISQDNSEEIEEAEVNSVENVIKFIAKVPDSFRLYNKLNGSEKVYAAGKYSFEIDLVTGNILSLIRIS